MEVIHKDQAIDDIKFWKKSGQKIEQKRERFSSFPFVVPPGVEPGTHGFSVRCSTN